MSNRTDYYNVLSLRRDATGQEIRAAFHKLAKKFHPDKNPGNKGYERRFKEITEAYEVLSDPDRRAKYDQLTAFESTGFDFSMLKGFDFGELFKSSGGLGGLGGLYDMFFGGRSRKPAEKPGPDQPAARGDDIHYTLNLGLKDIAQGGKTVITVPGEGPCDLCSGSGLSAGGKVETCEACQGRGQKTLSQGSFAVNRPCDQCLGRGQKVSGPCPGCTGRGLRPRDRRIRIDLPPALEDGAELKVKGHGRPGRGGPPGDLRIKIQVDKHPFLHRTGKDLFYHLPLNAIQAMVGTVKEVPLVDGSTHALSVPPSTQPGTRIPIPGKGLGGGDLVVIVDLKVPALSPEDQERLRLLAKSANIPL